MIHEWKNTLCVHSKQKDDLVHIRDMHRLLSYKGGSTLCVRDLTTRLQVQIIRRGASYGQCEPQRGEALPSRRLGRKLTAGPEIARRAGRGGPSCEECREWTRSRRYIGDVG